MGVQYTHEEFIKKVYDKYKDEYEIVGEYISSDTKIEILHKKCGRTSVKEPSSFLAGRKCAYCNKFKKIAHEEFIEQIVTLVKDEYEVLDKYINNSTKVRFLHTKCGREFSMTPNSFKMGQRCSHCFGKHKSNTEEFKKRVHDLEGDSYKVLGEYVKAHAKILIKHDIESCGHIYEVTPSKFFAGRRCPKCGKKSMAKKQMKPYEEFERELAETHEGFIVDVGEYKGARKKMLFKDIRCGHKWESTPEIVARQGCGCPRCKSSKGEKFIEEYLNKKGVKFKQQYRFSDCTGTAERKVALPFDFALFKGSSLVAIIEYDGSQHFGVKFSEEEYERTVRNDKIKDDYCSKNKIHLIRIPYWKFDNLEQVLNIILMDLDLI